MRTFILFAALGFLWSSCSKDNQPPSVQPPTYADTLTAGWSFSTGIPSGSNVTDVFFINNSKGYATVNDEVYKSENGGVSWTKADTVKKFFNIGANGNNACFVGGDSTIRTTHNGGLTFQSSSYFTMSGPETFCDVYYVNNNIVYALSRSNLWKSNNGGLTFNYICGFTDRSNTLVSLFFYDENIGWALRGDKGLYRTMDGGISWTQILSSTQYSPSFYMSNLSIGYMADGFNVYKTTNGGVNWNRVYTLPANGGGATDIHFVNSTTGYICAKRYLIKTTDGGANWTPVVRLGYFTFIEVHFTDENHGWATYEGGGILRFNQ